MKRGAELSTDHHLVVCSPQILNPRPNKKSRRSSVANRIKWETLEDLGVMKQFESSMTLKFRQLSELSKDIEIEWSLFRKDRISAAVESYGRKRLRKAAGSEKRTSWLKTLSEQRKTLLRLCGKIRHHLLCNPVF